MSSTGDRISRSYLEPRCRCGYVSRFVQQTELINLSEEFEEVLRLAHRQSLSGEATLLIDARPASSYQAGHIPTSLLLDFPSTLLKDPDGFTYLGSPEELKNHIAQQLGRDTLGQIVSHKATVVNSESLQKYIIEHEN